METMLAILMFILRIIWWIVKALGLILIGIIGITLFFGLAPWARAAVLGWIGARTVRKDLDQRFPRKRIVRRRIKRSP